MTLKWGIVGAGDVAEHKGGPALYGVEGSELIAVMRRDEAKAADFAQRHGARRWYSRVSELLAESEINAVYVATPVHLHHEQTIQAAEAGKHVLCEKPMALNTKECQQMIQACQANGVKLMIAYYRRAYPVVQRMKALLAERAIGEPMLVRINLTSYYNPQDWHAAGEWRARPENAGGGVLFDVGSHRLDVMSYLLGPASEVASLVDTLHASYRVEDSVVIAMRLQNGMHGIANLQWNIGSSSDEFEIYGTKGKMLARSLEGGHLEVYQGAKLVEVFDQPRHRITHWGLVENFVDGVANGAPLICAGQDGLTTNALMEAIYRASREGKTQRLEKMI